MRRLAQALTGSNRRRAGIGDERASIGDGTTIAKVLVGRNGTSRPRTESAIHVAATLARHHDAELVVVDVTRGPDIRQFLDPIDATDPEECIASIRQRYPEVKARSRTASGDPVDTMVRLAKEENAELVVLANLLQTGEDHAAAPDSNNASGQRGRSPGSLRRFYGNAVGWATLLLLSGLLTFGGGGVLFWVHAVVRGERGPAINSWHHWLLDSTLGFLALTPVLFFLLPAVLWMLGRKDPDRHLKLWSYVGLVGVLFTLVTGPGPALHNRIAGEGTSLAELATRVMGHDAHVAERNMHAMEHSSLSEALVQVAVGLPVYLALTWLALRLVRAVLSRRRKSGRPSATS